MEDGLSRALVDVVLLVVVVVLEVVLLLDEEVASALDVLVAR